MNNKNETIESLLSEFSTRIREVLRADVIAKLGGGAIKPSAKPLPASKSAKGQKRSTEALQEMTGRLLETVRQNPGERIEEIGKRLGLSTRELALPVRKLIADRKIKSKGARRGTRYFA